MWFIAQRSEPPAGLADRALGAVVTGLFAGRLVAMIGVGINPLGALGDILIIRGGVSTAGASIVAITSLLWSTRRDAVAGAAAVSAAALAGLAGWHAGCLFRGACFGTAAPWGRHPVELYAAGLLVIGAGLASYYRARVSDLALAGSALAWAAAARLVTEPLRPSLTGGPRVAYAVGIGIGLLIATIGIRIAAENPGD